jgi:hypothetical protein
VALIAAHHLLRSKVVKLLCEQGAFVPVGADDDGNAVECAGLKPVTINAGGDLREQRTCANAMGSSGRFTPSITGLNGSAVAR